MSATHGVDGLVGVEEPVKDQPTTHTIAPEPADEFTLVVEQLERTAGKPLHGKNRRLCEAAFAESPEGFRRLAESARREGRSPIGLLVWRVKQGWHLKAAPRDEAELLAWLDAPPDNVVDLLTGEKLEEPPLREADRRWARQKLAPYADAPIEFEAELEQRAHVHGLSPRAIAELREIAIAGGGQASL